LCWVSFLAFRRSLADSFRPSMVDCLPNKKPSPNFRKFRRVANILPAGSHSSPIARIFCCPL
jgi:hypothetical protein